MQYTPAPSPPCSNPARTWSRPPSKPPATTHCSATTRTAAPTLIHNVDEGRAWAEKFVSLSTVVKASDEDLQWLYPDRSLDDTARAWLDLGAELMVITRGEDGPIAFTKKVPRGHQPARTPR